MIKYVYNQNELDNISVNDNCFIIIDFNKAIITQKYKNPITIIQNHLATIFNNTVIAKDSSNIIAKKNSHIIAQDNSFVIAEINAIIEANDSSCISAKNNVKIIAKDNSKIVAKDNCQILSFDTCSITCFDNCFIYAQGQSNINAFGQTTIYYEKTATISVKEFAKAILINENKLFSFNKIPLTIKDYVLQYNLTNNNSIFIAYKVAQKIGSKYYSSFKEGFEYIIGEEIESNSLDININQEHGEGIHMAHLDWLLKYAEHWDNPAILAVECELDGVIIPVVGGKIRAKKCKILREISLEDCGTAGIVLKRKIEALKNY